MSSSSGSTCHTWLCCLSCRGGDSGCRIGFCGCHADCGEQRAHMQPTGRNLCSMNLLCCGVRSQHTRGTLVSGGTNQTVPHTQPPATQQMSYQTAPQPASSNVVTGYPQPASAPASSGYDEPLKPPRSTQSQYPAQMTSNTYQ